MRIIDYFNPFSSQFNAVDKFANLSGGQKILTVALTALASLVSFGLGGVAVFRALVNRFHPMDLGAGTRQSDTAGKVDEAKAPLLPKISLPRRKPPENMGDRTRIMRSYLAQELGKNGKAFLETEDTGDCFFDAVAQTLMLLKQKEISMKEIRMACHEYIQKLDKEEPTDNWLRKAIGKETIDYDYKSLRDGIQYIAEEQTLPIWGDAIIARIVSRVFEVKVVSYSVMSYEIEACGLPNLELLNTCFDQKRVIRRFLEDVRDVKRGEQTKVPFAELVTEFGCEKFDERADKAPNNQTIEIASCESLSGHVLGVVSTLMS